MNTPAVTADHTGRTSRRASGALDRRLARLLSGHTAFGALLSGMPRGFHKQLLLAWVLVLMLPALVAALPVTTWLHAQFGHSPSATAIAQGREPALFIDAFQALGYGAALLGGSTIFAALLALALSPWLAGMIIAQIRTVYRLRTGGVLRAGLGEYPRMLRMLLWSIVPLGVAVVAGGAALWVADVYAQTVVLAQHAVAARWAAWFVGIALFVLTHVTVEAGRAWLGADLAMTSVIEAWKRGVALLARRPCAVLVVYAGTTSAGLTLGALFFRLRLLLHPGGWSGWLLALVFTELAIAAVAWSRSARLHGLADLATGMVMAQEESALAREQDAAGPPVEGQAKKPRFQPGQFDRPTELNFPQMLIGRQDEIAALNQAFRRTLQGPKEMVLVSGEAGVGKTALVSQLNRPATEHKGLFLYAKADQAWHLEVYPLLVDLLDEFCRLIVSEPESSFKKWQERIQLAVAPHGKLLTDLCPRLETIIGPQPPFDLVENESVRICFEEVVMRFVQAICRPDHHVVIILDSDLQWVNPDSFQLWKSVYSPSVRLTT